MYSAGFAGGATRGKTLEVLVNDTDFEWLMIDAGHVKVHPDTASARVENQKMGRTKGGLTPRYIWLWMRMVCRFFITSGGTSLQMMKYTGDSGNECRYPLFFVFSYIFDSLLYTFDKCINKLLSDIFLY